VDIETEISGRTSSSSISIRPEGVYLSTSLGDILLPWRSLYTMMSDPEIAENLELVEIFNRDIPLRSLGKTT